jgi:hypothetical protein
VKVKYINNKIEYTANLDQAWVWVRLEDELGLTVTEAEAKMSKGSTKIITYAIWIASDSETPYKDWVKTLDKFEVANEDPKDIAGEASKEI